MDEPISETQGRKVPRKWMHLADVQSFSGNRFALKENDVLSYGANSFRLVLACFQKGDKIVFTDSPPLKVHRFLLNTMTT